MGGALPERALLQEVFQRLQLPQSFLALCLPFAASLPCLLQGLHGSPGSANGQLICAAGHRRFFGFHALNTESQVWCHDACLHERAVLGCHAVRIGQVVADLCNQLVPALLQLRHLHATRPQSLIERRRCSMSW